MPTQRKCLRPCKKIRKRSKKSIQSPDSQVSLPKGSSQGNAGKTATKGSKASRPHADVLDGEELAYCSGGLTLLRGIKRGSRILCYCCNSEVSASVFEAHAGFASRRKPYSYIYVVSTGVLLRNLENKPRAGREAAQRQDNHCYECNESGGLQNCSGCRKLFHLECASLVQACEKWFCTRCQSLRGRDCNADRITIQTSEKYNANPRQTKCCLCSGMDFTDSSFGLKTILLCDQCEREYHVGCLKTHGLADLEELPEGNWFCCSGCEDVHTSLQNLTTKGENLTQIAADFRFLKGPITRNGDEKSQLLSQAIQVLEKGFGILPCEGARHGLIRPIVNGTGWGYKQFGGMYCAVLLVNSKVVSVAVLRLFGQEFAELPLVTTLTDYQNKGYFTALFDRICEICTSNGVKKIVVPSTKNSMNRWLNFGFKEMTPEQVSAQFEYFPDVVQFCDVSVLEKILL